MNNIYSNRWWYCIQGTHLRGAVTNITNKKNAIPEVWGVRQLGTLEVHKRGVKRSSKNSWFQPFWGEAARMGKDDSKFVSRSGCGWRILD